MDADLRFRVSTVLDYLPDEWHVDKRYNKPIEVIEQLESSGVISGVQELWDSVEKSYRKVRHDSAKSGKKAKFAYEEAKFLFEQLKKDVDQLGPIRKEKRLREVLYSVDEAIIHCPASQCSTLAKYYILRSEILASFSKEELALAAVQKAARLDPDSIMYKVYEARLLSALDRNREAASLITQAEHNFTFPRAADEAGQMGQYVENLELIYQIRDDIQRKVAIEDELGDPDVDCDCEPNPAVDEYSQPLNDGNKNFCFDYRLAFDRQVAGRDSRTVVATEIIESGELLLQEKVYSLVPLPNTLRTRCAFCTRDVTDRFSPCHKCTDLVYCAEACAYADWARSHQFDCGLLKHWILQSKSQTHVFQVLNRVGVDKTLENVRDADQPRYDLMSYLCDERQRVTEEQNKDPVMVRNTFRVMHGLLSNSDKFSHSLLSYHLSNAIECAIMACLAQGYEFNKMARADLLALIEHCFTTVRQVLINSFLWNERNEQTGDCPQMGSCVSLIGSMFNHACNSNCEWEIQNGTLFVSANRQIEADEEITISYGPSTPSSVTVRQVHLLQNYFFLCNCSKCIDECRSVLALQCPACSGPVPVYEQLYDGTCDAVCASCQEAVPGSSEMVKQLTEARAELTTLSKILIHSSDDCVHKYRELLISTLDKVRDLIYHRSDLLVESIYETVQVLHQRGFTKDCLLYGEIVDQIVPLKGPGLMVLTLPDSSNHSFGRKSQFDINLDHIAFWNGLYQTWIKSSAIPHPRIWSQAVRFQERLAQLVNQGIEDMETRKNRLTRKEEEKKEKSGSFNTYTGWEDQIGLLKEFKSTKLAEWNSVKDEYMLKCEEEL